MFTFWNVARSVSVLSSLLMRGWLASWTALVKILPRGRHRFGRVSNRVGLEWVSSGFINFLSMSLHCRASQLLSCRELAVADDDVSAIISPSTVW